MASTETVPIETSAAASAQKYGWLVAATIFLSAFLLFQVQLVVAKYLLPWFGGAPAVWTTSMLFFQVLLLAGYFYAHRMSSRLSPRRQSQLQIGLLAGALVVMAILAMRWGSPITPGPAWRPADSGQPIRELLRVLTVSLGLPFFLLATTSPLLQRWVAMQGGKGGAVYRLYAVSNLGSLLGLVSYPFLVEPNLRILTQAKVWTAGFVLYAIFSALCAWRLRTSTSAAPEAPEAPATEPVSPAPLRDRIFWFALSMCGSLLLLSTTSLVSEDMGVVPLMWVLPLTLYLLTFILCFSGFPFYLRSVFLPAMAFVLVMATMALFRGAYLSAYSQIYVFCFTLFVICMVCHGELARSVPAVQNLTNFYLIIACGGAAGGILTGIVAPLVFRGLWEYHIALVFAALLALWAMFRDSHPWLRRPNLWLPFAILFVVCLVPRYLDKAGWATIAPDALRWVNIVLVILPFVMVALIWMESKMRLPAAGLWFTRSGLVVSVGFLALMLYIETTAERGKLLLQGRNFYGVLKVRERNGNNGEYQYFELLHGRILHGMQLQSPKYRETLTTYYTKGSGLGLAIMNHPWRKVGPIKIGAVGMGVGTVAGYVRAGDLIRFYEINPQVMKLDLGDNAVFTYLNDCKGRFEIVRGDARLSMERELEENRPQQYDVLILDAFSSDAIPVHLLTLEAMQMYEKHLRNKDSVIAVHISNRAVDLKPVVAGLAQRLNMQATWVSNGEFGDAISASDWVILSHSRTTLDAEEFLKEGRPMLANTNAPLWTDDYSDLFSLIKK
ncbi:MAG TPA: hypothetical protein VM009_01205 [Terriglobales bacterium]|nr:hypothetical protein [Terriglobales bacterium]